MHPRDFSVDPAKYSRPNSPNTSSAGFTSLAGCARMRWFRCLLPGVRYAQCKVYMNKALHVSHSTRPLRLYVVGFRHNWKYGWRRASLSPPWTIFAALPVTTPSFEHHIMHDDLNTLGWQQGSDPISDLSIGKLLSLQQDKAVRPSAISFRGSHHNRREPCYISTGLPERAPGLHSVNSSSSAKCAS